MNVNEEKMNDIELLAGSSLFRGIPAEELAGLAGPLALRREIYGESQLIQERGRPADRLRLVLKGAVYVDLLGEDPQGKADAGRFVPGSTLGLEAVFSSGTAGPSTLIAAEEGCDLLSYEPGALLCEDSPPNVSRQFLRNCLGELSDQMIRAQYWLQVLSQRSLRDKILTFAGIMCGRSGRNSFTLNMNQSQFAAYLRVARPSLNRELQLLKKEGVLKIKGRKYTVLQQPQRTPPVQLLQAEITETIPETDCSA